MKPQTIYLVFVMAMTFFAQCCNAESSPPAHLIVAVGHVGVLDEGIEAPLVFKIEYRFAIRLRWNLMPAMGAARSEGGEGIIFLSIERDIWLTDRWILSPSFGPGIFEDGKNVNLGYDLEFRTGIKLFYQLETNIRFGIELYHLSNGGLSDRNPGTEPAFISLSIPF